MTYMPQKTYSQAKARLTRAINSGDHRRVMRTVAEEIRDWDDKGYVWPDDWSRWERAYDDAFQAARRSCDYGDEPVYDGDLF